MSDLPTGTVTMLLADIEGSTSLVHRLEARYGDLLDDYRQLLRAAVQSAGGYEVDCRADEFFAAFRRAQDGMAAAVSAQHSLVRHVWPDGVRVAVRMGLHTGEPAVSGNVYLGIDLHRAVRICSAAHGGQILLSQTTYDLVADRAEARDLGTHTLAGVPRPERIFQLITPELRIDFPRLRVDTAKSGRVRRPPRDARAPTLAETAGEIRRRLPETAAQLQKPLAELGSALFVADRLLTGADGFLVRVDAERLERRLAVQRRLLGSKRAEMKVKSLQAQVDCIQALEDRRRALGGLARHIGTRIDVLGSAGDIASLHDRVVAAVAELDDALTHARRTLEPMSFTITRTRHRGIYRSGRHYVVPFADEYGDEQQREFETLAEACSFRSTIREARKGKALPGVGEGTLEWLNLGWPDRPAPKNADKRRSSS